MSTKTTQAAVGASWKDRIAELSKRQPAIRVKLPSTEQTQHPKATLQAELSSTPRPDLLLRILRLAGSPQKALADALDVVERVPSHDSHVILGIIANHLARSAEGAKAIDAVMSQELLTKLRNNRRLDRVR